MTLISPPKLAAGQSIAVLSPSFAAPGFAPAVHEQAMARLTALTDAEIVEYPTTRRLGASPEDRAADLMAAMRDESIGAILATIGGEDQITVIPHLDVDGAREHPTLFCGYSDNTHLHTFLTRAGVASFYGGSTQVQLGPGPHVDEVHATSLLAALRDGGELELTEPGESEDFGYDWLDPRALTDFRERRPTEDWQWFGPEVRVSGHTYGGCVEVLKDILLAGTFPRDDYLDGAILLLETSEEIISQAYYFEFLRALGIRGVLERLAGLVFARPPATSFTHSPTPEEAATYRADLIRLTGEALATYAPHVVGVAGVPFGHTRPQWIVPHGGQLTLDGAARRVFADYGD